MEARGFFEPARRWKGRDVYPRPPNWVYCRRVRSFSIYPKVKSLKVCVRLISNPFFGGVSYCTLLDQKQLVGEDKDLGRLLQAVQGSGPR